jgi:hypothetical protein
LTIRDARYESGLAKPNLLLASQRLPNGSQDFSNIGWSKHIKELADSRSPDTSAFVLREEKLVRSMALGPCSLAQRYFDKASFNGGFLEGGIYCRQLLLQSCSVSDKFLIPADKEILA